MNLENMLETIKGITKASTLAAILAISGPISCSKQTEPEQFYSEKGNYSLTIPLKKSTQEYDAIPKWAKIDTPYSCNVSEKTRQKQDFFAKTDDDNVQFIGVSYIKNEFGIIPSDSIYLEALRKRAKWDKIKVIEGTQSKRYAGGIEGSGVHIVQQVREITLYGIESIFIMNTNRIYTISISSTKDFLDAEKVFNYVSTNITFFSEKHKQ